jgi:hypothetical protein
MAATPQERLELLLPWLNVSRHEGEWTVLPPGVVRRRLRAFLQAFDGSKEAGFIKQIYTGSREAEGLSFFRDHEEDWPEHSEREEWIEDELFKLRHDLVDILNTGFPNSTRRKNRWWDPEEFESMWFGVEGGRRTGKPSAMTARERREHLGSGAYVLLVDGNVRDLVRFLLGVLLTQPGMMIIKHCPAPKPKDWKQSCDRFFLSTPGRGRPRTFCSDACRVRASEKAKGERNKRTQR